MDIQVLNLSTDVVLLTFERTDTTVRVLCAGEFITEIPIQTFSKHLTKRGRRRPARCRWGFLEVTATPAGKIVVETKDRTAANTLTATELQGLEDLLAVRVSSPVP